MAAVDRGWVVAGGYRVPEGGFPEGWVVAWLDPDVGFFGPVLHAYPGCGDVGPHAECLVPVLLHESTGALSPEWCCWKCGDTLSGQAL